MSKAVLLSIKPKWCELIANGKKTVEVRKTKPKIEMPFKCYIYCTQGDALALPCLNNPHYTIHRMNNGTLNGRQMTAKEREQSDHSFANGKVIGEFVCDEIEKYTKAFFDEQEERDTYDIAKLVYHSRIKYNDLCAYVGLKDFYAWHISGLVIYDKPKELSELYSEGDCDCMNCKICAWFDKGNGYNVEDDCNLAYRGIELHKSFKPITRATQSWRYVEEDTDGTSSKLDSGGA